MTTTVPLKPHLACFVTTLYGNPAVIPVSDQLYYDFIQSLQSEYTRIADIRNMVSVKFHLPRIITERIGHTFSPSQVNFFNQRLSKRFIHDCTTLIAILVTEKKYSRRKAIQTVIERFGIEEHYSYYTMKNIYEKTIGDVHQLFSGASVPLVPPVVQKNISLRA